MTVPPEGDPFAGLPTREDVQDLTAELARQDRRGKWNRRLIYALALILGGFLVLGFFVWRSSSYAVCNTNRAQAITQPGSERVSYLINAFKGSALATAAKLTPKERAADLAELSKARATFPAIPTDPELAKLPPAQVLVYLNVLRSIRADDQYQDALANHPVCRLWGN